MNVEDHLIFVNRIGNNIPFSLDNKSYITVRTYSIENLGQLLEHQLFKT